MTAMTTPAASAAAGRPDNVYRMRDGRLLGYGEYGERTGTPFILFHGMPGSRISAALAHEAAAQHRVRVIAPDRPGYGLSDFKRQRTIGDWSNDVVELADALGLERFAVAGISGGGPYAAACARYIPERLTFAAIISGVGPLDSPGATDGMSLTNRMLFGAARRVPPLSRAMLEVMSRLAKGNPERMERQMLKTLPAADRAVLADERVQHVFMDDFVESFRQGARGAAYEAVLYARPWGFRLADIAMPVTLWQGEADVNVTPAMGRYQAQALPQCNARFFPDEGHLLVATHMGELMSLVAAAP